MGRHARPGDPDQPSRTAVLTTAARLLVAKYDRAVEASGDADGAALWVYLPDSWVKMAEQLARVLVREADDLTKARAIRAGEGEISFICPGCEYGMFELTYSAAREKDGGLPYRVICARCGGAAGITESGPLDGSHVHQWGDRG